MAAGDVVTHAVDVQAAAAQEGPRRAAPAPDATRVRRRWLAAIRLAVSAALIVWILRGVSIAEVLSTIGRAQLPLLFAALGLNVVGWLISVSRWRLLLAAQGVDASFGYLIRSYMVGIFFNNLLPSTVGGDAVRAYDSWRLGGSRTAAVTVVVVDRFMGVVALALFAFGAVVALNAMHLGQAMLTPFIVAAGMAVLGAGWLLFMPPAGAVALAERLRLRAPGPIARVLARLAAALAVFRGRKDALAGALALSLALQANVVLYYFVLGRALDLDVGVLQFLLVVPPALAVMAAPISINAIGLREGAFAVLLGVYGVTRPEAIGLAWTAYLLLVVQGVAGGVVYALRR